MLYGKKKKNRNEPKGLLLFFASNEKRKGNDGEKLKEFQFRLLIRDSDAFLFCFLKIRKIRSQKY